MSANVRLEKILVVEDDSNVAALLRTYLQREGFDVTVRRDGRQGFDEVAKLQPALIVLDIRLPTMDGWEFCRQIRRISNIPIIILTAQIEEADKIAGLRMGADDYVVKPFSPKELAARCRVALRRAEAGDAPNGYQDENFEVDFEAFVVRYQGRELRLTQKEFEILRYLLERPGRVLSRERILERIWGFEADVDYRSIDAHIRRLRQKLGEARAHVETVVGVGYRFVKEPSRSPPG